MSHREQCKRLSGYCCYCHTGNSIVMPRPVVVVHQIIKYLYEVSHQTIKLSFRVFIFLKLAVVCFKSRSYDQSSDFQSNVQLCLPSYFHCLHHNCTSMSISNYSDSAYTSTATSTSFSTSSSAITTTGSHFKHSFQMSLLQFCAHTFPSPTQPFLFYVNFLCVLRVP